MPEEYKGYFNAATSAYDKALELKKKKDEMQLQMIEKAIDPIWSKYDTEGAGAVSKSQCQDMVVLALEQIKMSQHFNQAAFDKLFEQVDTTKSESITKKQCVDLVNLLVFGGL